MISCNNNKSSEVIGGHPMVYPIPSENPVYFTSEAQTKNIFVENITWIVAENPETEIVEIIDVYPFWVVIENDWLEIRFGKNIPKETVRITVKENTSAEPRTYNLLMHGFPASIAKVTLEIVQEGK